MTYRCLELLDLYVSSFQKRTRKKCIFSKSHCWFNTDRFVLYRPTSTDDETMSRPSFLLDIGAGSGLSGEILTEEGHEWVGLDVSGGMLG